MLVVLSVQQGNGTEACMSAEQLKHGVEQRLKRRVFVASGEADLRLGVTFSRQGDETEAHIALSSIDGTPRGTRSLATPGHCSALDDSLALSVALMVDEPPDPEPAALPPSAAPAASVDASPATPSTPPVAPQPRKPPTPIRLPADVIAPREPWHASVGAAAAAAWGALPGLRPALALYLKLAPPRFVPILLQGEAFSTATAARDSDSGARFRLFRMALAVCPSLYEGSRVSGGLCLGQKLGWLSVEGYGFDHDRKEQRLNFALTAGGEARLQLFALVSIRGYLGLEAPLARDRFTSAGRNSVDLFQPSPLAILGEFGLEAALW